MGSFSEQRLNLVTYVSDDTHKTSNPDFSLIDKGTR